MIDYSQISDILLHNEKHPSVSPLQGRICKYPLEGIIGVSYYRNTYCSFFYPDDSN